MRGMIRLLRAERGATAVLFGLLLIPLLGFGGIAVDVGALYSERAQLQNGADSVALEVAIACGHDESSSGCGASDPSGLAGGNALDRVADIQSVTIDHDKNIATVTTKSENLGVRHPLAAMLPGVGESTVVQARGSAEWGAPIKGTTIPLTIADCEFDDFPAQAEDTPNPTRFDLLLSNGQGGGNVTTCADGYPGGFGWLNGSGCRATTQVSTVAFGDGVTGIQGYKKAGCSDADFTGQLCKTILLPLYDSAYEQGHDGQYRITRFAAFVLTGYLITGGASKGVYCGGSTLAPALTAKGIQGYFVRYVSLDEALELGDGAPDAGLTQVRLTLRAAS